MDSTKINIDIKIPKDTLIKINNENSISIKYLSDTTIAKNKCCDTIWINPIKDIIIQYEWLFLILISIIIFYKSLIKILDNLSDFIKRSKRIELSKNGFIFIADETEAKKMITSPDKMVSISKSILSVSIMNKIFSTFWKYQKEHEVNKHITRWSFALTTANMEYDIFIKSIIQLIKMGYVAQDLQSQQFYLTNNGIDFCKANEKELKSEVFTF